VRYKGEIFFAAPLHFQRLMGSKCLHGQPDCLIEDSVDNVEWLPLHPQAVAIGEIMNTAA